MYRWNDKPEKTDLVDSVCASKNNKMMEAKKKLLEALFALHYTEWIKEENKLKLASWLIHTGFASRVLHKQGRDVLVHTGFVLGYAGIGPSVFKVHVADVHLTSISFEEEQRGLTKRGKVFAFQKDIKVDSHLAILGAIM